VLVDARHGRSDATGTPPKLGWNIGCELELNYRGDNARLLIYVLRREIPRLAVQPKRPIVRCQTALLISQFVLVLSWLNNV